MSFFAEAKSLVKKNIRDYGMYIALAVIVIIFTIGTNGNFISSRNISNWINQTGYIAVLAVGMTLILIIRHIDISVGYLCGFIGAFSAILMTQAHFPAWLSILASLALGLCIGMFEGFLVAGVGVPSFVVSLAGMLAFRGMLMLVTQGTGTIIVPDDAYNAIGNGFIPAIAKVGGYNLLTLLVGVLAIIGLIISQVKNRNNQIRYRFEVLSMPMFIVKLVFISAIIGYVVYILAGFKGISWTLVIVAAVVAVYNFMLNKTPFGRHIYGVGGNAQAAQLSGINVKKITFMVFASMGLLSALAGILFTARSKSATTTAGTAFEMDAIAAAYVGGVSADGGIGKVTGTIVGAFVMSSLMNGMNLMGVDISFQYIIKGAILVLAVIFDITTRKNKKTA
jgi:putative multiple sugar transport system permease protein